MARSAACFAIGAALLLTACGTSTPEADAPASNAFVPPVTRAPEPVAGQEQATPLTAYVGRYPRDAVAGVTFYDRTDVANALIDAVAREDVRRMITGREAVSTPIFRRGPHVAAHGCEAHNCADRNWTVLIAADGNRERAAVCFHDADTMRDASEWSTRAGTERRPGDCPQS